MGQLPCIERQVCRLARFYLVQSKSSANRLIGVSEVYENLSSLDDRPTSERQTRPLEPLAPAQQIETWQLANEIAGDKKITARQYSGDVQPFPRWLRCPDQGSVLVDFQNAMVPAGGILQFQQ